MANFDWHSDLIKRETPVTGSYKSTQNVRRFMALHCGEHFKFDRPFMQWIKDGIPKTMGDVVDEWVERQPQKALSWPKTWVEPGERCVCLPFRPEPRRACAAGPRPTSPGEGALAVSPAELRRECLRHKVPNTIAAAPSQGRARPCVVIVTNSPHPLPRFTRGREGLGLLGAGRGAGWISRGRPLPPCGEGWGGEIWGKCQIRCMIG